MGQEEAIVRFIGPDESTCIVLDGSKNVLILGTFAGTWQENAFLLEAEEYGEQQEEDGWGCVCVLRPFMNARCLLGILQ